ncbi:MAG: FAD-dependent oxidoreductase [Deltaproteobacteria bacterium]|nr:FAD-dependent oxidoreductase [Deltaproteobacteria bacterium]
MNFPNIFTEFKIKNLTLKNRIVLPAMVVGYADDHGRVTDRYIKYLAARAKGGTGLLITEAAFIAPAGRILPGEIGIYDDSLVPGLKRLIDQVHCHGAKIAIQINHGGRQTHPSITNCQVVAPSPIPCPRRQARPKPLTIEDIQEIIQDFTAAAWRAREAGADAIEIHGAHGYLINQFLSPYSNQRTDRYGGSPENRLRFALEILASIRERIGRDFPIIFRLSADEFVDGGLTIRETGPIARQLVQSGVDILHVSGSVYGSLEMMIQPMLVPPGCFAGLARQIKQVTAAPVITVGRINDPALAENLLAGGTADLIAMGRAQLADPDLVEKIRRGEVDDIRKCVACVQGCVNVRPSHGSTCLQNPALGRDEEMNISPADAVKSVVIVGGGPGGLEAARVAALRGHQVVLFEEQDALGGQINLAAIPPGKGEFQNVISWRVRQLKKLKVDVRLSMEASADTILQLKPDVVVIATGAGPCTPSIPGLNGQKNISTAADILKGRLPEGRRVCIIGGGLVGCETALYLAGKIEQISIVELRHGLALDADERLRIILLKELMAKGIDCHTDTNVVSVSLKEVSTLAAGQEQKIPSDSVVVALGSQPRRKIADELEKKFTGRIFSIGDCVQPRNALEAIREGFDTALKI